MKIQELRSTTNLNKQQVITWLDEHKVKNYQINRDLSVDVDDIVILSGHQLRTIPVKFNEVSGGFRCDYNYLISLQGGPQQVGGDFFCNNNELTSLEGAPWKVGKDFNCINNPISSLHNVHRQIREINEHIVVPESVKSHILGLMRIRGLQRVYAPQNNNQLTQALKIINRNLDGRGDIHTVQEQLLDAGLAEFAQI